LPRGNSKGDIRNCGEIAVAFSEMLDFNHN
jgi:hypothetical protein